MIVVSDTGPIHYLFLIGEIEVLPRLYHAVAIPGAVAAELSNPATPKPLREWFAAGVPWMERYDVGSDIVTSPELDVGEREAVTLAINLHADFILMDDEAGRLAARRLANATVTGTIGVLYAAALQDFHNQNQEAVAYFNRCISLLQNTNFYFSASLSKSVDKLSEQLQFTEQQP